MGDISLIQRYAKPRILAELRIGLEPWLAWRIREPVRVASKADAPCFSPTRFLDAYRLLENAVGACALVLDLDDGVVEGLRERLERERVRAFCWTTLGHRPGCDRRRLVFPLRRLVSAEEYRALCRGVARRFGVAYDPQAADMSRASVMPAVTAESAPFYEAWETLGDADLAALIGLDLPHGHQEAIHLSDATHGERLRVAGDHHRRQVHREDETVRRVIGRTQHDRRRLRANPGGRVGHNGRADDQDARGTGRAQPGASPPSWVGRLALLLALLAKRGLLDGRRHEVANAVVGYLLTSGVPEACAEWAVRLLAEQAEALGAKLDMHDSGRAADEWATHVHATYAARGEVTNLGTLHDLCRKLARETRRFAFHARATAVTLCLTQADAGLQVARAISEARGVKWVQVTPGAGKSHAARAEMARALREGREVVYCAPTHELLGEHYVLLRLEHGVAVALPTPSPAALRDEDSAVICARPRRVSLAVEQGQRAERACAGCSLQKACAPRLEAALARQPESPSGPHVRAVVHGPLARSMRELDHPETALVVVDEPPALVERGSMGAFDLEPHETSALTPFARAAVLAAKSLAGGRPLSGAERADLAAGGPTLLPGKRVRKPDELGRACRAVARAYALGEEGDFFQPNGDELARGAWQARAAWVGEALRVAGLGGRVVVLDATPAELDAAVRYFGEAALPEPVHVADAPGVTRSFVQSDQATASGAVTPPNVKRWIQRDPARPKDARVVGVVTWRDALPAVVEAVSALYPGAEVRAMHFGALRGLNGLQAVDLLVVVGSFYVNADAAGLDSGSAGGRRSWRSLAQCDLVQAVGRARPTRAFGPLHVLHVGKDEPDLHLAPQWAGCAFADGDGRAVSPCGLSFAELAEVRGSSASWERKRARRAAVTDIPAGSLADPPRADVVLVNTTGGARSLLYKGGEQRAPESADRPFVPVAPWHPPPTDQATVPAVRPCGFTTEDAQPPAEPAERPPVAHRDVEPVNMSPEQAQAEEDEAFSGSGSGAGFRRRLDERAYPFPSHELTGAARLPASPRVPPDAPRAEQVQVLLRAFWSVMAQRCPRSRSRHLFRGSKHLERSRFWARLADCAAALAECQLSPTTWVDWSAGQFYAQRDAPPRTDEGPPWRWLLSANRVRSQHRWCAATAYWGQGVRLVGPLGQSVLLRYRCAEAEYALGDDGAEAVFARHFPEGYAAACAAAREEAAKMQARLKEQADGGLYVWGRGSRELMRAALS